jgi:hypothetical protein
LQEGPEQSDAFFGEPKSPSALQEKEEVRWRYRSSSSPCQSTRNDTVLALWQDGRQLAAANPLLLPSAPAFPPSHSTSSLYPVLSPFRDMR